jgi:hypothetical protein
MGGPGLATKHLWMRMPMTEFPHTTNFAACGGYRPEIGFCRFLWLRNSGWPRQAFSPFLCGARCVSRLPPDCHQHRKGQSGADDPSRNNMNPHSARIGVSFTQS